MATRRVIGIVIVLVATLPSSPLSAQPPRTRARSGPSAESREYRALIDQALEEYDAQNYAEARALFLRAHTLQPNARTLRGLGMVEFELRNYIDSVARLEQALSSSVRPLSGELRRETEQLLVRARSYIARVALVVEPAHASGLRVSVDGAQVEPNTELDLAVGEHVFLAQAEGYQEERRDVSIKGAEQQRVVFTLRAMASPGKAPALALAPIAPIEDSSPASDKRPVWKNPWLWTGIGLLVAGGVTAGVILGTRPEKRDAEPIPGDIGGVVQTLRFR